MSQLISNLGPPNIKKVLYNQVNNRDFGPTLEFETLR